MFSALQPIRIERDALAVRTGKTRYLSKKSHVWDIVHYISDMVVDMRGCRHRCPRHRGPYPWISSTMSRTWLPISADIVHDIPGYRRPYPHMSSTMFQMSSSICADVVVHVADIDIDMRGYRRRYAGISSSICADIVRNTPEIVIGTADVGPDLPNIAVRIADLIVRESEHLSDTSGRDRHSFL